MWLLDDENVENHVALTGRYAGHAVQRRETGRLKVDNQRKLTGQ